MHSRASRMWQTFSQHKFWFINGIVALVILLWLFFVGWGVGSGG